MKRTLTTIALCAACASAGAQYTGPSAATATSVEALANTARHDQSVTLQGRIVSYLGDEDYLFADDTGQIKVAIESRLFPAGTPIDARTPVRIVGKVDREWSDAPAEIDIEQLILLN
jgi:uncharacterized protein (TIGR00156 family)